MRASTDWNLREQSHLWWCRTARGDRGIGAGPAGTGLRRDAPGEGDAASCSNGVGRRRRRKHYDRLHLHTVRWLSYLPGFRMPGDWQVALAGRRPRVPRALRRTTRWRSGPASRSRSSIAETQAGGQDVRRRGRGRARRRRDRVQQRPLPPRLARAVRRRDRPLRRLPQPGSLRRRRVLVVGAGNSGAEIAVDLADGGAADGAARRSYAADHRPP